MYDWANSAFATTIMAGVFPVFYESYAGAGLEANTATSYWAFTQSIALLIIALISPILGATADYLGAKKRFMSVFLSLGVTATATMYFIGQGQWLMASAVFICGNIGFSGANVFYESLLPFVAKPEETDRVSTAGYALGYLGGGVLLFINLLWILMPERFGMGDTTGAARWSFVSVAVWWAAFSIPVFRDVAEPPRRLEADEIEGLNPVKVGFARVWETLHEVRGYRDLAVFLLAFWFYNDGIGTIIKMAVIYGAELGIAQGHLLGALLLTQIVGVPFAFGFGKLADRIGPKRGLYLALTVYTLICCYAYFLEHAWQFWTLAVAVGTVQGGAQALSRSIFASMVPRGKSSEFFGFFSVSAKFAGILGPLIFGAVSLMAGGSRISILALVVFFVGGMVLLRFVDIERGQAQARAADAELHPA
jgi:UMF1 family MFS transporter